MSMAVIRQGGRGAGDPPLTIPNREVKPRSADGTGKPGEQGAAPVEGKASEGHLRGLLFFLRHRDACPLPAFVFAHRRLPFGAVPHLPASFRFISCLPGGCGAVRGSAPRRIRLPRSSALPSARPLPGPNTRLRTMPSTSASSTAHGCASSSRAAAAAWPRLARRRTVSSGSWGKAARRTAATR